MQNVVYLHCVSFNQQNTINLLTKNFFIKRVDPSAVNAQGFFLFSATAVRSGQVPRTLRQDGGKTERDMEKEMLKNLYEGFRDRVDGLNREMRDAVASLLEKVDGGFVDTCYNGAWAVSCAGDCSTEVPVYGVELKDGELRFFLDSTFDDDGTEVADRDGEVRREDNDYLSVNWLSVLDAVTFNLQ